MTTEPTTLDVARVDWLDPRAVALRTAMDAETSAIYAEVARTRTPEQLGEVERALTIDPRTIATTIVLEAGGEPVAHGALRPWGDGFEVKKVFVSPSVRGRGVAQRIMTELENVARELGARELVLQTGELLTTAVRLYERLGYERIPVFEPYRVMADAVCMRKVLAPAA